MQYVTRVPVTLRDGIVALTEAQAAARAHALQRLDDGAFRIVGAVQFKVGEIIGLEGEVPKNLFAQVEVAQVDVVGESVALPAIDEVSDPPGGSIDGLPLKRRAKSR